MCSNFTSVFVFGVTVIFTIHSSTLEHIVHRRAQGESKGGAFSDLRNKAIAQNFCLRMARPGTQRDRSLMRPVTAPCSHDPPTLQEIFRFPVGMRPVKAGPARRSRDTAKVAVFRLASSHPQPETLPRGYPNDCPSLSRAGGAKRAAGPGPAARSSTATGARR